MGAENRPGRTRENTTKGSDGWIGSVRKRVVRRGLTAFAGTFSLIALIALVAPAAAAASVVSHSAPYTGATLIQLRDPVTQGCGASLSIPTAASFSLTTGQALVQAKAKSTPCTAVDSQANYDGKMGLKGLAFTVPSSGSYNVVASWSVTWNASATMNAAAGKSGAQATVELYLVTTLTDVTGKTTLKGTHSTVFIVKKDMGAAGTFSAGMVNGLYTAGLNGASLIAGHHYKFYAIIVADVQTTVPAGSAAASVATATIDLATGAHGGWLTALTVA